MNVEPVSKVLEPWLERACQTLGTILGQGVQVGLAQGENTPRADLEGRLPSRFLAFPCSFAGTLPGQVLMVLSHEDAGTLVNLLSGGDGTGTIEELTGLHTDVLAETMQQVVAALHRRGDRLGHLHLTRALLPAERRHRGAQQLGHGGRLRHWRTLTASPDSASIWTPSRSPRPANRKRPAARQPSFRLLHSRAWPLPRPWR